MIPTTKMIGPVLQRLGTRYSNGRRVEVVRARHRTSCRPSFEKVAMG